ncbi:DMT family transporter [Gemmobacter lutimaris]|uniref:DMT family transporter n=1 Tax=Gemmobacter lutimaris TaxID=2306023 RepID=A0A398BMH7_9RHOB|nr:DMT family transporter [Gemmobacter lutimaris]RID91919.1 DMT family transporter [Gemmobacter lutimaris]
MLASGFSFVGVTGLVRWLGTDLPAAQGAFLRFAFGVMFLLPTLGPVLRGGFAPGAMRLFALRGAVHTVAVICWFYAMARLPVAEVTAIGYLNPVLVTVGAAVFLGEKLAMRRILAVCVAILGALVILRPGVREVTDGHLAQVAAAFGFAGSYLVAKRLSGMASAGAVVAMMSLMVTLGLAPFALAVWVPVTPAQLAALAGVAAFATSGHYCMTRAFAVAPLTVTQPVTFLQLLWATLLGMIVFHETVDVWVLAGGGVIIAAVSYITWREAVLNRRGITPPVLATKS